MCICRLHGPESRWSFEDITGLMRTGGRESVETVAAAAAAAAPERISVSAVVAVVVVVVV